MMIIAACILGVLSGNPAAAEKFVALTNQAEEYRLQNQHSEADQLFETALEEARKFGPEATPVAVVLDLIGNHRAQLGDMREAIRLSESALAILSRSCPVNDHHTIDVVISLSTSYLEIKEVAKAENLVRQYLGPDVDSRPDENAALLANLGAALSEQGRYQEAEVHLRENLSILENQHSEQLNSRIIVTLTNLATICVKTERMPQALNYIGQAVDLVRATRGLEALIEVKTFTNAGAVTAKAGEAAEAARFYQSAIARCEAAFGPDHYYLVPALEGYAQLLVSTHRGKEAAKLKTRAQKIDNAFNRENVVGLTVDAHTMAGSLRANN